MTKLDGRSLEQCNENDFLSAGNCASNPSAGMRKLYLEKQTLGIKNYS